MSLASITDGYNREYDRITRAAIAEISLLVRNASPEEAARIVSRVYRKYGIDEKTGRIAINMVQKGAAFGVGVKQVADPVEFRRTYLNHVYDPEGVTFSQRIAEMRDHGPLINALRDAMAGKQAWNSAAQSVFQLGLQKADVAKDIRALISKARGEFALSEDGAGFVKYKTSVQAVQRRIDRLVKPSTSTLKNSYQRVVDLTADASVEAVEKAAKYAHYFKEKYNTTRIVSTEVSRAYGQARIVEMAADDDVVACRSKLNSGHEKKDVCDFYATADLYGMGPGIYPKDHLPPYPYHPFCACSLIDVYAGEVPEKSVDDFNPAAAKRYLKQLPADEQAQLLGKAGAKAFRSGEADWQEVLKSYNPPVTVTPKIPLEVLRGRSNKKK